VVTISYAGAPLRQFRNVGVNTTSANWSFHRDYVYRNGGLLAAYTPEGLHHFHLDHLGSPRIIIGANGTTLPSTSTSPSARRRPAPPRTPRRVSVLATPLEMLGDSDE
jgi:hypothetical protein